MGLLGIPFEVVPSRYEEVMPGRDAQPARLAMRLAAEKAAEVAGRRPGSLVIGADTIVVLGQALLGKPRSVEEARWMLAMLSGKTHQVITGLAVIDDRGDRHVSQASESTRVHFRDLALEEVAAYVASGEPMDKAGAYGIQGRGGLLVRAVTGDYNNVVGLPVTRPMQLLRARGVEIMGRAALVGKEPNGVE